MKVMSTTPPLTARDHVKPNAARQAFSATNDAGEVTGKTEENAAATAKPADHVPPGLERVQARLQATPAENLTAGQANALEHIGLNLARYRERHGGAGDGAAEVPTTPEPTSPAEPVVTEPVVAEPVVAEPVVTEPIVAEPVVTEPVVAEPIVTEPVVTVPVIAEPIITEPVVAEPVVTEPVVEEPAESVAAPAATIDAVALLSTIDAVEPSASIPPAGSLVDIQA